MSGCMRAWARQWGNRGTDYECVTAARNTHETRVERLLDHVLELLKRRHRCGKERFKAGQAKGGWRGEG